MLRFNRLRNEEIREDLEIRAVLGYTNEVVWTYLYIEWKARMISRKGRGRQSETWNGVVGKILRDRGTTWQEAKQQKFIHRMTLI